MGGSWKSGRWWCEWGLGEWEGWVREDECRECVEVMFEGVIEDGSVLESCGKEPWRCFDLAFGHGEFFWVWLT